MSTLRGTVIEVVASLAVGGAERVALELAAGVVARGGAAELVCAAPGAGAPPTAFESSVMAEAERRGVHVHRVGFPGVWDRAAMRRLARLFEDRGASLVHVHNRPQDWQVVTLCRLIGLPAIYTIHLPYEQTPRQRALYAAVSRAVPAVVCVSRAVADHARVVERVPADKLHVIYNGLRAEAFATRTPADRAAKRAELGWAADDFVWLCAARLSEQKGHTYLLDAFDRLPATSRARLVLAGDGPLEADLRAQCARLSRRDRVTFLGPRRDVPELLDAADGYSCSSLQEGHPLSLLEAMAAGLPVVGPRIPSIVEIADAGATTLFGPAHAGWADAHDPAALARALADVEADARAQRERAGRCRGDVITRFSMAAMIGAHEELYGRLSGNRTSLGRVVGRLIA